MIPQEEGCEFQVLNAQCSQSNQERARRVSLTGALVIILLYGLFWRGAPTVQASSREPESNENGSMQSHTSDLLVFVTISDVVSESDQRRLLPQPASNTATPRISLPTDTAEPGATKTNTPGGSEATPDPATPDPAVSPTPDETGGGSSNGSSNDSSRDPSRPAPTSVPGLQAGQGLDPDSDASAEDAQKFDSQIAEEEQLRENLERPAWSIRSGGILGSEVSTHSEEGGPVAPRPMLAAPVADPALRRLWLEHGELQMDRGLLQRLTERRPLFWSWALIYPLLFLGLAWAFRRAWRALPHA